MADIKTKYPATSSASVTITLATLASDSTLAAGRASSAVDNTTNSDLDHLLTGLVTTGTSPVAGGLIEVWVYASRKTVTGTPTYPSGITGSDANKSFSSFNVKNGAMRLASSIMVDSASNQSYEVPATSIAALFGGMPKFWGVFVVQSTGVALNSTAANHDFQYERIQAQTV